MITIKTKNEIEKMDKAGNIVSGMHEALRGFLKAGLTTLEVNDFCEDYIRSQGGVPVQIGYQGFPYATCTSVNDVICHGIPNAKEILKNGDLLKVDTVVELDGYMADSCWAHPIGDLDQETEKLMLITKKCLDLGIEQAVVGNRLGDIGHAIQSYAEEHGYSVVREFTGHGIGTVMHEEPMVLHYGRAGRGQRLEAGMTITIEPMINSGGKDLYIEEDGWTARTEDGLRSCQFEHTLAITEEGPRILTLQNL